MQVVRRKEAFPSSARKVAQLARFLLIKPVLVRYRPPPYRQDFMGRQPPGRLAVSSISTLAGLDDAVFSMHQIAEAVCPSHGAMLFVVVEVRSSGLCPPFDLKPCHHDVYPQAA